MTLLNLHIQHTELEDFATHVRRSLDYGSSLMRRSPGTIEGVMGGEISNEWFFRKSGQEPVILLQEAEVSSVHRVFGVRYIHQFRVEETLALHIIRYQSNELRLLLNLDLDHADPNRDTAAFAKKTLSQWLRPRWGDAVTELGLEDAPVEQSPATFARPTVYSETDVLTTVVHYLVTQKHLTGKTSTQQYACDRVGVAPRTYRNHRDYNKLLSHAEFHCRCGKSIEMAAKEYLGLR